MNIVLIGATGYVGNKILAEALARGHSVTAIVRHAGKLPEHARVTGIEGDATDASLLAKVAAGHDVVISAFNPGLDADDRGTRGILEGVKRAGAPRFLAVGGAGSLLHPVGGRVIDQPDFPAEWKQGAQRTAAFLELLQGERELDWVFVSPPAMLAPGERTGKYRVGGDTPLTDAQGLSRISLEDYAVAMLDEAERPQWHRQRFTVGY